MKWTVTWEPSALARLTDLWMDAVDKSAITRASFDIDDFLANSPLTAGESRDFPLRILFVPPLCVHFKVNIQDHMVSVSKVQKTRR